MNINTKKLSDLRKYFLDGGSNEAEDIAAQLNTDEVEVVNAYLSALREKYPNEFGDSPDDSDDADDSDDGEEEPAKALFLISADKTLVELEVAKEKADRVILRIKEPKDLVTLTLAGKQVQVDLIQLAKHPDDSPHGIPNSKLIELANLARA
jgi:hypothetical protein